MVFSQLQLYQTCSGAKHRLKNYPNYRHIGMLRSWWESPGKMAIDLLTLLGPRPKGWSLDRINPRGHYVPNNLRWAPPTTQQENKTANVPIALTAGEAYDIVIPQDDMTEEERQKRYRKYRKTATKQMKLWRDRNRKVFNEYRRKRYARLKKIAVKGTNNDTDRPR